MTLISLLNFKSLGDSRGSLIALEAMKSIPFEIKRVYYLFDTKKDVTRGLHAHRALKQVMICIAGNCKVTLDDGVRRESIILNSADKGLLIEGLIWRELCEFSSDCVLLVVASELFEESDYIRSYKDFKELVNNE